MKLKNNNAIETYMYEICGIEMKSSRGGIYFWWDAIIISVTYMRLSSRLSVIPVCVCVCVCYKYELYIFS